MTQSAKVDTSLASHPAPIFVLDLMDRWKSRTSKTLDAATVPGIEYGVRNQK
jgi:hypothetical protein